MTLLAVTLAMAIAAACMFIWQKSQQTRSADAGKSVVPVGPVRVTLPMPEPLVYRPLTAEEAVAENKEIPLSSAPLEVARSFNYATSDLAPLAERTAADCLTAAIYYEAGQESIQGKRAVAQVVLNRVRHPAYPTSVCKVVYQGSEQQTGCQFTFTCDGSLARLPQRGGWEEARKIALAALTGSVEPSVGMSTHYHANYVVPYWASSLDKVAQIGAHLFYKWKGSWGRRAAFTQVPRPEDGILETTLTNDAILGPDAVTTSITPITLPPSPILADDRTDAIPPRAPIVSKAAPVLDADEKSGSLTIDDKKPKLKIDQ